MEKVSSSWDEGLRRGAESGKENNKNSVNEDCLVFGEVRRKQLGRCEVWGEQGVCIQTDFSIATYEPS